MNVYLKNYCLAGLLAGALVAPAYAGLITLKDSQGNTLTSLDVSGEAAQQVVIDLTDLLASINKLRNLGLDAGTITTLLINAGANPVSITEIYVTEYPDDVLAIVDAAAKSDASQAADVASAAATLVNDKAADIAGTAAKYVTTKGQANQIALQVGLAVGAMKSDGEPNLVGRAIAKAIAENAPASLQLTETVLAQIATRGGSYQQNNNRGNDTEEVENPQQAEPVSPS